MATFERSEQHDDYINDEDSDLFDADGKPVFEKAYSAPIPVSQHELIMIMNEVLLEGRHWAWRFADREAMGDTLDSLVERKHAFMVDSDDWVMLHTEPAEYDRDAIAELLRTQAREAGIRYSKDDEL